MEPETIEAGLKALGLRYVRDGGRFYLGFAGPPALFLVLDTVEVSPGLRAMVLTAPRLASVPEGRRSEAAEVLARLNFEIVFGSLGLDPEDGEIRYRWSLAPGIPLGEGLRHLIGLSLATLRGILPEVKRLAGDIASGPELPSPEAEGLPTLQPVPETGALRAELARLEEERKPETEPRREALCRTLLEHVRREEQPILWGALQGTLANLYQERYRRTGEERWAGLAEEGYLKALEEHTREKAPQAWATTHHNLANLYQERYRRTGEERWADLAEEGYLKALEEYTREKAPQDWATTHHNLANLYSERYERTGEERWAGLAEEGYLKALEEHTREKAPQAWATTHHNLANLYQERYRRTGEERWADLAEEGYLKALEEYTREKAPQDWATTHHNLANLYSERYERTGEERWADLAEEGYLKALEEHTREKAPQDWAMTHHNLASLYSERYRRTGEERWADLAEEGYLKALEEHTREKAPQDWAMTHNNLANLYSERYERTGEERWADLAEEGYLKALEERTREKAPQAWATTHHNLANLYSERYRRTGEERWADLAEGGYLKALEEHTREKAPQDWAMTHHNLANLYSERYERTGEERWADLAEEGYLKALEERTREKAPQAWATTHHNLANLYQERYRRTGEERWADLAEGGYLKALEEFDAETAPTFRVRAARRLGYLQQRRGRLKEARSYYEVAVAAARSRYRLAADEGDRLHFMAEDGRVFSENALVLVQLGSLEEALCRADEGRARVLAEAFAQRTATLAKLPARGQETLRAARSRYREAQVRYERLGEIVQRERELLYRGEKAGWSTQDLRQIQVRCVQVQEAREKAYRELREAREEVERLTAGLGLDPEILTPKELSKTLLPADIAALSLLVGEKESVGILWRGGDRIQTIPLPHLTGSWLKGWMDHLPEPVASWVGAFNRLQRALGQALTAGVAEGRDIVREREFSTRSALVQAAISACKGREVGLVLQRRWEEWKKCLDAIRRSEGQYKAGWYYLYRLAFDALWDEDQGARQSAEKALAEAVRLTLEELRDRLWKPVAGALPSEVRRLLLVPSGPLGLLPVAAAAPDGLTVGLAPSLKVWLESRREAARRSPDKGLLLASPAEPVGEWGVSRVPLRFAWAERKMVTARFKALGFPTHVLAGDRVLAGKVLARAVGKAYFHFSGHAHYRWDNPGQSALECRGRPELANLTLDKLRREGDLSSVRLAVLSACETGVADPFHGEEFVGLPAGMMTAGAPAVVASLWPVRDVSTAFLMDEFYRRHLEEGKPLAQALAEAARWLSQATKAELMERVEPHLSRKDRPRFRKELEAATAKLDPPFQHPLFWAPFVAFGAVLE
jgi:CHAT domain-containing protein